MNAHPERPDYDSMIAAIDELHAAPLTDAEALEQYDELARIFLGVEMEDILPAMTEKFRQLLERQP